MRTLGAEAKMDSRPAELLGILARKPYVGEDSFRAALTTPVLLAVDGSYFMRIRWVSAYGLASGKGRRYQKHSGTFRIAQLDLGY